MSNDFTGLTSLSEEEFEQLVRDEYARLRAAWFPAEKPDWLQEPAWQNSRQPAELSFVWNDLTANCAYASKENRLIIAAEEGWLHLCKDTEDGEEPTLVYSVNVERKFTRDWVPWRVFLLHEMCHEYQFKVLCNHDQTSVGREMFHEAYCLRNRPVRFSPTGLHPTPFLAAIASLANHLGANRIELFDRL